MQQTPTGLKAMQQMQELNTKKDTATNPMIMFLVLKHLRTHHHPYHHRLPCLLWCSPAYGCLHPYPDGYARGYACRNHHHLLWQRINILQPVLLATLLGMCAFVGIIIWGLDRWTRIR